MMGKLGILSFILYFQICVTVLMVCCDLKSMFSVFQTGTLLSLPYSSQREALSFFL